MKIVIFTRSDFINGIAYSPGEIAGWPDHVADRLVSKGYAQLYNGDGKVRPAGGRIPNAKDWLDEPGLNDHVTKLKKDGAWPKVLDEQVVVMDREVAQAARERMAREMNQLKLNSSSGWVALSRRLETGPRPAGFVISRRPGPRPFF